ncbi:MAG: bifunctional uridylyltransferase/uridylyl-removing protein, partial [Oxalobacter sp.]|nr:bifunctional uridylyltransferase/uridylyl-removing protein [Oxalobacter sp.]
TWKGKLLEDLLVQTKRVLGGENLSIDHELEKRQQEAKANLRLYGIPESAHEAFWKQLDIVYFLRNDALDIAWHTRTLYARMNSQEPVVQCRVSPTGEGLQVVVYMRDRPDLFAWICSYFDRKNFAILDAKIHTTKEQYALDTFLVTRQGFENQYRDITSQVEHDLTNILKEPGILPEPTLPRFSRKTRVFPVAPSIDLRPDANGRFVLSITGNDYRGLLYAIARVFSKHRINLHTAKIMTLGERIEDVFLIDGEKLQQPRQQIQFERDMIEVLRVHDA